MSVRGVRGVRGRRWVRSLLVVALAAIVLPGATETAQSVAVSCPAAPIAKPLKFSAPPYIDTNRAGGDPVSVVALDGSIIVSAHAGTTHVFTDPNALPGAPDFAP